jgi:hypothetical protein
MMDDPYDSPTIKQPEIQQTPPLRPSPFRSAFLQKGPLSVLLICGVALLLLLFGMGAGLMLSNALKWNAQASVLAPTPTPAATPTKPNDPYKYYLQLYGPAIKKNLAAGLHLTPEQLQAQVAAGKSIDEIAQAQNLSKDQLNALIGSAFTSGLQPAVDSGGLTKNQVSLEAKDMQKHHKTLDKFLKADQTKKKPTATPTATPKA